MPVLDKENNQVQSFKFGQLIPSSESGDNENSDKFVLKPLKDASAFKNNITAEVIRSEREFESKTSFEIDSVVKEHRGLVRQADDDYEKRVALEVERRIQTLTEEAYKDGFSKGQQDGEQKAYAESIIQYEEKVEAFSHEIVNLQEQMREIYSKSHDEAYLMVKNLTKWIILKEVDEKYYLARLLEKIIHEINTKSNILLHVNESSFGYMPEIIKIVERKLGVLTNVRIEIDYDMTENGIVIESENTIVDASLDSQFEAIDRLFRNVGVNG
jgi:flagellar assembly protein FliH